MAYYIVQKGDTLTKISRKFGLTIKAIMEMNPDIKDRNLIRVGQRIQLISEAVVEEKPKTKEEPKAEEASPVEPEVEAPEVEKQEKPISKSPEVVSGDTSVVGVFTGTAQDLIDYFARFPRHRGVATDLNRAKRIAPFYIKWGNVFNLRADIAWCQMCKETGFLTYLGDVKPDQNNFAGIGAVGGGAPGNRFATEELGVIAQISHLAWYYFRDHVNEYCSMRYDPRHFGHSHYMFNGNTKITRMNGSWAVPGRTYGQEIGAMANEILSASRIYDLILQMGHVGRTSGATGTPGEQAFTEALGNMIADRLKKKPYISFRLMGADNWYLPKPNVCRLFFSLHADGALNTSARGLSVGYPVGSENSFATAIAEAYRSLSDFPQRPDNYTNGLKMYYAWRNGHVKADFYCLLEHGFFTNAYERKWINENLSLIADCHVNTIAEFLKERFGIKG